jgi:hypothetical protein
MGYSIGRKYRNERNRAYLQRRLVQDNCQIPGKGFLTFAHKPVGQDCVPVRRITSYTNKQVQQIQRTGQCTGQRLAKGEILIFNPSIVEIDKGIMHHIKRVRNISQEPAQAGGYFVRCVAPMPPNTQAGEKQQRHKGYRTDRSSTDFHFRPCGVLPIKIIMARLPIQKDPLTLTGFKDPVHEQSGRKREQQTQRAAQHIVSVKRISHTQIAIRAPDGKCEKVPCRQ